MPTPAPHKQPHQTQWEKVKLGDIAEIKNGSTPSTTESSNFGGDIVWITPKDLSNQKSKYIYTSNSKITKKGYKSCSTTMLPLHTICLTSRAPIGLIGISKVELCTNQGFKNIIVNDKKCFYEYLYYFLTLRKNDLQALGSGTKFKELNTITLTQYQIPLPPLPTQENIAQILSTLDKKIELNTRINTELESMVKLLYTRYFVEFNFPDSSGKPYKASGGAMVYSPTLKREIPKDWEVASLNDICHLYQPKTIAEKDLIQNGKYFVYGANGIIGRYDKYNHEESEIVITCRGASCGNILRTIPQVWITGNAMVASPKNKKIHKQFIKNTLEVIGIKNTITGSAQPQITRENLKGLYVAVPNDELLEKYFSTINPIYEIFIKNQQESQRLAEWRDYLLPLLMGDQVEVV